MPIMKNILALASICVGLVCAQAPAPHQKAIVFSDGGGAIAHFLDGDGWKTTLTLVNLDATQASFTISFFGDDGNPLAFNINGVLTSTLSGVISARGAYAMTTSGTKTALSEGWAISALGTESGSVRSPRNESFRTASFAVRSHQWLCDWSRAGQSVQL